MGIVNRVSLAICLLIFLEGHLQSQEAPEFNPIYDDDVQTVRLFPLTGRALQEQAPAVLDIRSSWTLRLAFDLLYDTGEDDLYVKLEHFNAAWQPSRVPDLQFLDQFNEFLITEWELSFDTRVPYTHFWFDLPRVKIPGNYKVMVYKNGEPENKLLEHRFMVYDNIMPVAAEFTLAPGVAERRMNHQINVTANYDRYPYLNPYTEITVNLRQNYRWDNMIQGLEPSGVREFDKTVEFKPFNFENNFPAWNESRFFDIRSLNFSGVNVARIDRFEDSVYAFLATDLKRGGRAYTDYQDLNGNFFVENRERDQDQLSSDYWYVFFYLDIKEQIEGDVYIIGELNHWNKKPANKMKYLPQLKLYEGKLLLKQGYYNYLYYVDSDTLPPYFIEGSYAETTNVYDLAVYIFSQKYQTDLLVYYQEGTLGR
jgi:hypothetical protein